MISPVIVYLAAKLLNGGLIELRWLIGWISILLWTLPTFAYLLYLIFRKRKIKRFNAENDTFGTGNESLSEIEKVDEDSSTVTSSLDFSKGDLIQRYLEEVRENNEKLEYDKTFRNFEKKLYNINNGLTNMTNIKTNYKFKNELKDNKPYYSTNDDFERDWRLDVSRSSSILEMPKDDLEEGDDGQQSGLNLKVMMDQFKDIENIQFDLCDPKDSVVKVKNKIRINNNSFTKSINEMIQVYKCVIKIKFK